MPFASFDDMHAHVGQQISLSDWVLITQESVNRFAELTDDPDWMHIDVERAKEGPVGQTIVQGFFTLSLLTRFAHQASYLPKDVEYAFNYGLDRVRWIAPLKVGKRIRNRMVLEAVAPKEHGRYLITIANTIEIEDEDRPAMVAQWLGLLQKATGATVTTRWP